MIALKQFRKWVIVCVAIQFALLSAPAFSEEYLKTIGNWSLNVLTDGEEGYVSCYIQADYKSGITMSVYFSKPDGFNVLFTNESWRLEEDEVYPVEVEVDRFGAWDAELHYLNRNSVLMGVNEEFISEFKRGYEMRVDAKNEDMYFALNGTKRAINEVVDCVHRRETGDSQNPFGGRSKSGKSAATDARAPDKNPDKAPDNSPDENAMDLMTSVVAIVLDDNSFANVSFVENGDLDDLMPDYDIRWQDGPVIGAAALGSATVDDQVQQLLRSDSNACNGKFGSAQEPVMVTNTVEVMQLNLFCDGAKGDWFINYLIIPTKEYFFLIAHLSIDTPESQERGDEFLRVFTDWMNE